jgi:hypothetical protein
MAVAQWADKPEFKWSLEPIDRNLTIGTAFGMLSGGIQKLMGVQLPMSTEWPRIHPERPRLHFNDEIMYRPFANWQSWPTEK